MTFLGNFHLIRPAWLLLVPIVVLLWWIRRSSQDPLRGWRQVIERELLAALTIGKDGDSRWRGTGLLVGWLLATVALAGPTWRPEPSPFADDPMPVMIVLRADETMDLTDLVPSRMERARLKVRDFAQVRKGEPLGLISYAGSAHLVLPPTRDTAIVATMAAEISPAIMPEAGDDLAGALRLADRTLGSDVGSIVVVTDTVSEGRENTLAEFRASSRTPVHFLAIARSDTPELDAIQRAAAALSADVTLMEPNLDDVRSLVRTTASAPVSIGAAGEGRQWAEAGWWLTPVLALLSLFTFRRARYPQPQEGTA